MQCASTQQFIGYFIIKVHNSKGCLEHGGHNHFQGSIMKAKGTWIFHSSVIATGPRSPNAGNVLEDALRANPTTRAAFRQP